MEDYFTPDIVSNILPYLTKTQSFNLINTSTNMRKSRKILYRKYMFNHDKIETSIAKHIRKIKCMSDRDIDIYRKLTDLHITGSAFNKPLDDLPNTLKHLTIDSYAYRLLDKLPQNLVSLKMLYCHPIQSHDKFPSELKVLDLRNSEFGFPMSAYISNWPHELESLYLKCYGFDYVDKLPETLKTLSVIDCEKYGLVLDSLSEGVELLFVSCKIFNYPFCKLPQSLKSLEIKCGTNNSQFREFPSSLETLTINWKVYKKNIDF